MFSRRDMLATTAVGGVMTTATMTDATVNETPVKNDITFGNPDDPPQGAINAKNPKSITDPGPQNPAIRDQFPDAFCPPATDVGSMPLSWASFNNAPRRIQNGGWARQVTQDSFAVAETISGVNMRLTSGGIREMHWHPNADEWQYWIKGKGTMTIFNTGPNAVTMNFNPGDIGYVKKNLGHYIKNTGNTDLQVLEVFRAPQFQDVSLSDWITHTPPSMVAQHLNVSEATIAKFPKNRPEIMPE
jgi:oxalate decarboxylase